jgi:hypothetical protein
MIPKKVWILLSRPEQMQKIPVNTAQAGSAGKGEDPLRDPE